MTDVDDYLAAQSATDREALQDLRERIAALVPDATERVSYQVPTFFHHGMLVGYGVHAKGLSLYVMRPALVATLKAEVRDAGLTASGGTVRFTTATPVPQPLLERIVRARVEDNLARGAGY